MKSNFSVIRLALFAAFAPMFAVEPSAAAEDKKPAFCKKSFNVETGDYTFAFGNGAAVSGNVSEFSTEIIDRLTGHGLMQKGGDSYASVKGNFAQGIENLNGVLSALKSGDWSQEREGSGPRLDELAAAIARIKGVSVEKAMAACTKATEKMIADWRSNAKVKAVVAQIRAEKAAAALQASEAEGSKEIEVELE